ncbi:hypothetical protein [Pantoea cypripedii]|uniref:Uncharacterized protein n=1 Tax=Pantoea cypripedii TaxID=55209 RepID=A0A1X1EYU8_PANCY|nr:hypothetical protein [Pantoea cypripedii]MBP2194732.1 hypothetical protein [Pantoea cypripedii]ORM95077.1 hypothetical protein HA50_17680 [Pantoea cypripedii]
MQDYFKTDYVKKLIVSCISELKGRSYTDAFQEERNGFIESVLLSMHQDANKWDEDTQFNIRIMSQRLNSLLSEKLKDERSCNHLYVLCFRFYNEFYLFQEGNSDTHNHIINFALDNAQKISEFDNQLSQQIKYALNAMNAAIVKEIMSNQDLKSIREFISVKEEATRLHSEWKEQVKDLRNSWNEKCSKIERKWKEEFSIKEGRVNDLKNTLDEYETAFNFVSLYDGFKKLGDEKKTQLCWAKRFLITLGGILPCLIFWELHNILQPQSHPTSPYDLLSLIPALALSLVLVYYFRVSLSNYNSVRAQLMQIELRMSLCQFIQNYTKYSAEINKSNPGLLAKFEEIVFSNIMVSEDKIPSTFDGLEQIASLISTLKAKG